MIMRIAKQIAALSVTALATLTLTACSVDFSFGPFSEEETAVEETTAESESTSTEETTSASSSSSSSSTSSSSASSTTSSSSSGDTEDYHEYDGISTHELFRALGNVEGMEATERESEPKELKATAKLFNEDQSLRADVFIYIPTPNGTPEPVESHDDEGIKSAYESAREIFKEEGHDIEETEIDTKNMEWKCVEAEQSQGDGEVDHAICDAPFAGRLVEVQRLVIHDQRDESEKKLETVLEKIDTALADLK